uniref:FAD-dependent oxidoreductase n=1 Tax=Streptomyces galilaeus TaxID=33899 RepID=UPI0038F79DDF
LAIALARAGITSAVIDSSDPAAQTADGFDGRASAISTASWNLYTNLGMAGALEPRGCPIAAIAVTDGMKPGRIDFQPGPKDG